MGSSSITPILTIVLAGLAPVVALGFIGVTAQEVVWRPPTLWTAHVGSNGGSVVTSVASSPNGVFAVGTIAYSCLETNNCGTTNQYFLQFYDQAGQEIWTKTFGNKTVATSSSGFGFPAITVGNDGAYVSTDVNGTAQITEFDFNGATRWTMPIPSSGPGNIAISAGKNSDFYLAGGTQEANPSGLFVSRYYSVPTNEPPRLLWKHEFTNSTGQVLSIYASPSSVYATGWVSQALSGRQLNGVKDAFTMAYSLTGDQLLADEFAYGGSMNIAESVSGNAYGVYVMGTGDSSDPGFVRQYDLRGNFVGGFLIPASVPGAAMLHGVISVDSSAVYLLSVSLAKYYLARLDFGGNQVWNLPLDLQGSNVCFPTQGCIPLATGANAVYVGTGSVLSFAKSSSLIFFGLNPPYSFFAIPVLPGGIVMVALTRKRLRKKRHSRLSERP